MGKFTVEQWRCDRCGKVAERWLRPAAAYSIRAFVAYDTAGGEVVRWDEMCVPCNHEVEKAVKLMQDAAKFDRAREAATASMPTTTSDPA